MTREGESQTLSRQFTLAGRQSSLTYPSGRVLNFERRDCACGVDGIFTHVGATEPVTLMDNLVYRPFGSATATDTGSGDTIANQHDADGRLAVTNPGSPREQQIDYDANGNLTSVKNPRRPWEDVSYTYFDTGWLKRAVGPYGVIDYTYDYVGNRQTLESSLGGVENAYVYQDGTNRISTVYGPTIREFTHDARGNMTLYDGMNLTYNADNRLMSVTESGLAATYTYNGFGQRISKTVGAAATDETTVFLWDFDGNIVAEYSGEGALKAEYLYRGANRLAMADAAGEVYFYQNDRLGTPLAITDKDNNAVWEATYLPFGQAMVNPNSAVENNFRFPGQYYDEETGLHYNYHRYYDPRTGRYVTADPIGLEGGSNLYIYANSNPINFPDPLGLWTRQIGFGVNWGVGGGGSHSYGFAISYDPCTGEKQFGFYMTKAIGLEAGGVLEGAFDYTWSENRKVGDLEGISYTGGGSVGSPIARIGVGFEGSFPIGGTEPSYTSSVTAGLSATSAEAHGFLSSTKTFTLHKWK